MKRHTKKLIHQKFDRLLKDLGLDLSEKEIAYAIHFFEAGFYEGILFENERTTEQLREINQRWNKNDI